MTTLTATTVENYLTDIGVAYSDESLLSAVNAEYQAQSRTVVYPGLTELPADPYDLDIPSDLINALLRRVAHNLTVANLPLGIQTTLTDNAALANRVGGTDAEVTRLELPYKRRFVG